MEKEWWCRKEKKLNRSIQFHDGAGFGLARRRAFSHLLLGSRKPCGVRSTQADEHRDGKPPRVDSHGFCQKIHLEACQPVADPPDRLLRCPGLVLIVPKCFTAIAELQGRFHR